MMLVFQIALMVGLVLAFIGAIGGRNEVEKSRMVVLFFADGLLFLLSFILEKLL